LGPTAETKKGNMGIAIIIKNEKRYFNLFILLYFTITKEY